MGPTAGLARLRPPLPEPPRPCPVAQRGCPAEGDGLRPCRLEGSRPSCPGVWDQPCPQPHRARGLRLALRLLAAPSPWAYSLLANRLPRTVSSLASVTVALGEGVSGAWGEEGHVGQRGRADPWSHPERNPGLGGGIPCPPQVEGPRPRPSWPKRSVGAREQELGRNEVPCGSDPLGALRGVCRGRWARKAGARRMRSTRGPRTGRGASVGWEGRPGCAGQVAEPCLCPQCRPEAGTSPGQLFHPVSGDFP